MKITYRKTTTGWRLRYVANNNEILATGEGYTSKQNCLAAIQILQQASHATLIAGHPDYPNAWETQPFPGRRRFFYWQNEKGMWHWRYSATNGEALWWAEGFTRKTTCLESIALMRAASLADVLEEPDEKPLLTNQGHQWIQ